MRTSLAMHDEKQKENRKKMAPGAGKNEESGFIADNIGGRVWVRERNFNE